MLLAYFHGEGVLFSFLIHVFFGVVGSAVLIYGLVKFRSLVGVTIAVCYVAVTLVIALISRGLSNPRLEIAGWALTLPWSAIVPCYNLDRSCSLSLAVLLICAELNAATLYFLVVWLRRPR
jgi:hypothetical protein